MKFAEKTFKIPDHDCDIRLQWPGGQQVVIQVRPSNADVGGYAGSLDFILPENQSVTCCIGDDLKPAPKSGKANERLAKQLIASMHDDWYTK